MNDSTQYRRKGEPGHDPLYKMRPFIEPLFENFRSCYTLSKEISVDESMIAFKGRLSFIQYMPKKPTKWGMKAFVLADSKTGYLYNWHLYTGKYIVVPYEYAYTYIYTSQTYLYIILQLTNTTTEGRTGFDKLYKL